MTSIFNRFNRLQSVRALATRAASSPLAKQMHATLTRELPSWLLELSALTTVEVRDISGGLNGDLARLIKVCEGEQKLLGSRAARNELAVRMSLARVGGVAGTLQTSLGSYTNALRRSDPRMLSITANTVGYGQPAAATVPLLGLGAHNVLAPTSDCRKAAEELRATLREVAAGARRVQRMLHKRGGSTPADLASSIAQTRVLVDWLRRAQARFVPPEASAASA